MASRSSQVRLTSCIDRATPDAIGLLRSAVYAYYGEHGRDLPWRKTSDPYHILVSEVMLQQTQVDRVIPKYVSFIRRFPDFASLASASSSEVLGEWQGLGYNRRALSLQKAAKTVMKDHGGVLPQDKATLMTLPGIGDYTASAIRAFAFNQPDAVIETNIRAVFIHHFFPEEERVADAQLLPVVEAAIDRDNPRRWYQALMDYGVRLKQQDNASRRSAHHRPQSRFQGSRRQARGEILRILLERRTLAPDSLRAAIAAWDGRFEDALSAMLKEGVVTERAGRYGLD
jgi:A/G-specific adenine glycosylase